MQSFNVNDLLNTLPVLFLLVWACILLLVDVFTNSKYKRFMFWATVVGLVTGMVLTILQTGMAVEVFNDMLVIDGFALFLNTLVIASGLLGVFLAYGYLKRMEIARGEYYVLLLLSITGMILMSWAADLIIVFLALELLSIPLYVLSAFARPKQDSEEAGLKYFLLGAFASGFLLYGIALVYGATASTNLTAIAEVVKAGGLEMPGFLLVGAALVLIGLGFKIAAVPFHMWTPDVYQGAPTPVTAFMSVGAKVAGFAALLRVFVIAFPVISEDIVPVLWSISAVTMIAGNVTAVAQSNIKRMLAYSSIAHAGYILMAFVPYAQPEVQTDTVASAVFYLLAYAVTNLGAWAVVITLERKEGRGLALEDYAGLGRKYMGLATAMTVFMLSFTGVPPTLGFAGKFFLFRAVLEGGYTWLALVGVVTSLISAYYYLRLVVIMFMKDGDPIVQREFWVSFTTAFTALATVVLFAYSEPLFQWAEQAILLLL
jgi:NADH-quinone oxidoreductase subunit N